jgi:uncharacterized phiE125 gp8 family phage protein
MGLKRTVAPINQPVSLEEAKQQTSQYDDSFNGLLSRMISAATEVVERYTGRALITQTWRYTLDSFCDELVLPRPPFLSLTGDGLGIEYTDENGDDQTLDASLYAVAGDREPARIAPAYGECWPPTRCQREAVRVTYTAGYGAAAASVPEGIRHAILLMLAHWFANREAVVTGTIATEIPLAATWLLDGYKTGANVEWYRLAE